MATTVFVAELITETSPGLSPELATYTAVPSGVTASHCGEGSVAKNLKKICKSISN